MNVPLLHERSEILGLMLFGSTARRDSMRILTKMFLFYASI